MKNNYFKILTPGVLSNNLDSDCEFIYLDSDKGDMYIKLDKNFIRIGKILKDKINLIKDNPDLVYNENDNNKNIELLYIERRYNDQINDRIRIDYMHGNRILINCILRDDFDKFAKDIIKNNILDKNYEIINIDNISKDEMVIYYYK